MRNYVYRLAKFSELFNQDDFDVMAADYAAESGAAILGDAKVGKDYYYEQEETGVAQLIVATLNERIVGFAVLMDGYHAHFDKPVAVLDTLYVTPATRKSSVGARIIAMARAWACGKGYALLSASAPVGSRLNALYGRIGVHTDNDYLIPVGDNRELRH